MISRAIHWIVVGFALLNVGAVGLAAYWLWWPITPYTPYVSAFGEGPSPILNEKKIVHPGEPILFRGGGFHHTDGVRVTVSAELQNSFLLGLPGFEYVTAYGEFKPFII